MPNAGEFMEDIVVSQRGKHSSLRRSQHICQHCGAPVTSVGGRVDMECVVHLDSYAKSLEKRLNSQSQRKGGRTVGVVKVDRAYLGCALHDDEIEAPPDVKSKKKAVVPPLAGDEGSDDLSDVLD